MLSHDNRNTENTYGKRKSSPQDSLADDVANPAAKVPKQTAESDTASARATASLASDISSYSSSTAATSSSLASSSLASSSSSSSSSSAIRASTSNTNLIDPKDLHRGDLLSFSLGRYISLFEATWNGKTVVVKTVKEVEDEDEDNALDPDVRPSEIASLRDEAGIMVTLSHSCIVTFYGYCEQPSYGIVMEFLPKGALSDLLYDQVDCGNNNNKKIVLDRETCLNIATDVASGVAYLHQNDVLHMDLNPGNILLHNLHDETHARLCDFGESVKMNTDEQINNLKSGEEDWQAPEKKCTKKADIYSMGLTLMSLITSKRPSFNDSKPVIISRDPDGKLTSLIKVCVQTEPDKRPDADVVVAYLRSTSKNFEHFILTLTSTLDSTAAIARSVSLSSSSSSSSSCSALLGMSGGVYRSRRDADAVIAAAMASANTVSSDTSVATSECVLSPFSKK